MRQTLAKVEAQTNPQQLHDKKGQNMATFTGTESEFNTFIGPRMRNKIPPLTKAAKIATNNICQHCGRKVNELDAAHVHGRERKEIIHYVLEKYRVGDLYNVDLQMFEQEFVKAHYPIRKTFLFLCKDCHNRYDASAEHLPDTNNPSILEDILHDEDPRDTSSARNANVDNASLPNLFKQYLLSTASPSTGRKYTSNTVNGYMWGIRTVCDEERCGWKELTPQIDSLVFRYECGGDKSEVGEKGKRTVINALKAFRRFTSTLE